MSIGRYYTVAQVSEITQYHQLTIRRAIYGREMAVYRNGPRGQIRIPESELKRWMKSKEIPASRVAEGARRRESAQARQK